MLVAFEDVKIHGSNRPGWGRTYRQTQTGSSKVLTAPRPPKPWLV